MSHETKLPTLEEMDTSTAIYNAALANVAQKEIRRTLQNKRCMRRERAKSRKMQIATALSVALLVVIALAVYTTGPTGKDGHRLQAIPPSDFETMIRLAAAEDVQEGEDPLEAEKIETALLEQGYFSLAVPMPFVYQDYMRTYCAVYGCPYPLALAVAQVESGFDMDAVGANGEVGIMQLNPGPSGAYHAELQAVTGMDPTTPAGNIADGCYLLGKYLAEYGDTTKAAMAYNMGMSGAQKAWAAGVTSTEYSRAVIAAMEDWECTVNPWDGV